MSEKFSKDKIISELDIDMSNPADYYREAILWFCLLWRF